MTNQTAPAETERAVFQEQLSMPLQAIQAATVPGLLIVALLYAAHWSMTATAWPWAFGAASPP